MSSIILDLQLDPTLDHVERPGGIVMPDLVRNHDHAHGHVLAGGGSRGSLNADLYDRTFRPLILNYRDCNIAFQPASSQPDLLIGSVQVQQCGDKAVGGEKSVAAMLAVVGGAVIVHGVARCRIV